MLSSNHIFVNAVAVIVTMFGFGVGLGFRLLFLVFGRKACYEPPDPYMLTVNGDNSINLFKSSTILAPLPKTDLGVLGGGVVALGGTNAAV